MKRKDTENIEIKKEIIENDNPSTPPRHLPPACHNCSQGSCAGSFCLCIHIVFFISLNCFYISCLKLLFVKELFVYCIKHHANWFLCDVLGCGMDQRISSVYFQ